MLSWLGLYQVTPCYSMLDHATPTLHSPSSFFNLPRLGVFVVISDEAGGIADTTDLWRWGEDGTVVIGALDSVSQCLRIFQMTMTVPWEDGSPLHFMADWHSHSGVSQPESALRRCCDVVTSTSIQKVPVCSMQAAARHIMMDHLWSTWCHIIPHHWDCRL